MTRFSFDGLKAVRKAQLAKLLPDGIAVDEVLEAVLLASEIGKHFAEKFVHMRSVERPPTVLHENADQCPASGKTDDQLGRIV